MLTRHWRGNLKNYIKLSISNFLQKNKLEEKMEQLTEDQVRDKAKGILGFDNVENVETGVGQLTTFNQLGFKGVSDKPDGWYLPHNKNDVCIILETKNSKESVKKEKWIKEINKNIEIVSKKYKRIIGILYNGYDVNVFKNLEPIKTVPELQNKDYYISLYNENRIDKQKIYILTKRINDNLHINFGIKNLNHRMIFTACALVAERYGANLSKVKDLGYSTFHTSIHSTLSKSLIDSRKQNQKLDLLLEVYSEIKMNINDNQDAINDFIDCVCEISESVNSDYWNGEDVMAIFFNEFNRYKGKSEKGQVFTPDHITSFMYRLIEVNKDDVVLDAACGSGAFLVKSMCNMVKEAGGVKTEKAKEIKQKQLFGIEIDREIFALACANMLIHKDGKTNLEQMDTRNPEAGKWIKEKNPTKVLMNPPFERKYGCLDIVKSVLDSVPKKTKCAFILPDKKLEKESKGKKLLDRHSLKKIIKIPENVFNVGVTTSIFVFESGVPQNNKEIFACYFEDDGFESVKNQGRQDTKNIWNNIENEWIHVIEKQSGNKSIQWLKPSEHLSYQMPIKTFEIYEEDFEKTMMDFLLFEEKIDSKVFEERILQKVLYSSDVINSKDIIELKLSKVSK